MLATLSDSLPLSQALRQFFPPSRTGNPIHISTGLRWHHRGVIATNGERVRLHAVRVGGVLYVRRQDAEAFLAALNADTPTAEEHADADMLRRSREAGAALEKLGC